MKNILLVPVICFIAITGIAETIKKNQGIEENKYYPGQNREIGPDSEMIEAEESAGTFEYGELDEDLKNEKQKMEEKDVKQSKEELKNVNHKDHPDMKE